jgi:alternative ribosome-rescue factor
MFIDLGKLMSKKRNKSTAQTEIGRGVIKDNFLAAVVTSSLYKQQIVSAKKGKGSYQRKNKFSKGNQESYLIAA